MFNQYFYSVFTVSSFQLPPLGDLPQPMSTLSKVSFTELDVFHVLQSLDPSKAMGCDGISPKLLKNCALALYQPLHHLFSLSLSQCYLPMEWRVHLIKPIFKSGDKTSVRNYRPISLLSLVSKILEKLVYNSIVDFLTPSISINQFGFLCGCSTLQQLLIFFNCIFSTLEPQTDVVYLDFRKAFDYASHNELLYKLWNFGITGILWSWVRVYLSNRFQCVSVGQSPISFTYSLNDKEIAYKSKVKDLGLIVSANSQWHSHYQVTLSKAYKILDLLRRVFSSSVSKSAKCSLYKSLVRSQLLYCSVVWHPYLLVDIKCLELVQRRATKLQLWITEIA